MLFILSLNSAQSLHLTYENLKSYNKEKLKSFTFPITVFKIIYMKTLKSLFFSCLQICVLYVEYLNFILITAN